MQKATLLNPRVTDSTERAPLAPQLTALRDARIAFVDNSKVNADIFLSHISVRLFRVPRHQAAGRGMGRLPIVEIPHPMRTVNTVKLDGLAR